MSVLQTLPDDKILEFKSRIFKVIGDANRLKVLEILRSGKNCQCDIIPMIAQSQSTVSRHLKLLEAAGLIKSQKEGTKTYYQVVDEEIFNLIDAINENMITIVSKEISKKYGL
jgi:ArsR family transcriptional regulator